jgi:hypothetical protein
MLFTTDEKLKWVYLPKVSIKGIYFRVKYIHANWYLINCEDCFVKVESEILIIGFSKSITDIIQEI